MRNESQGETGAQLTDRTSSPVPPPHTPSARPRAQEEGRPRHKGAGLSHREPGEDRLEHRSRWQDPTPQYLLSEDRQEFERILDEALRSAPHRPELAAVGRRLNAEQLRT
ncbi:hypothetical protein ACFY1B_31015, partial [Streptomyces mirabilis]